MIKAKVDVFLFEPPSGRFFYTKIFAVLLVSVVDRLVPECWLENSVHRTASTPKFRATSAFRS